METERTKPWRKWQWVPVVAALFDCRRPPPAIHVGHAIFTGERPLRARIAGHSDDLPQEAVRCTNCHRRETTARAPDTSQDFGPALSRERLTSAVSRRGGPSSAYDLPRFCRALREGLDPVLVMIPQAMPRYTFTDNECEALWTYLTTS